MVQGACQTASLASGESAGEPSALLAPAWHTRALVGVMLAVAATGTLLERVASPAAHTSLPIWQGYLSLALVNFGLCLYVSGVGLKRNIFAVLFSQLRYDRRRLFADWGWGAGLALTLIVAENGLQTLLGLPESVAAHALMPASTGEKVAWTLVAMLVGFSEELVYRGYLQRQLAMLSGWLPFGILAQSLLFGIAHGEQGGWAVGRFAVYGLALGWVAAKRQSLLPCVLCHVALDWVAALGG